MRALTFELNTLKKMSCMSSTHLKNLICFFYVLWRLLESNLPCLWKEKGEELGVKEDVFNEDIANDSIEWKLTRGLYVGCGVLVVISTNFCGEELQNKKKHISLIVCLLSFCLLWTCITNIDIRWTWWSFIVINRIHFSNYEEIDKS